jgi:amino acid transporter
MATWEFVLVFVQPSKDFFYREDNWLIVTYSSLSLGFQNGGFGGLFWVFIGTVVCYSTIVASLAEMESMAPTSGGQYHWVSEFAPENYQKFFSYAAGKLPMP